MSERPFAFIIGAGTAGTKAARALARAGRQVVIAEPARLGGSCVWYGCIPKKALFDAARAWRRVAKTGRLGILAEAPRLDWQHLLVWQRQVQETYSGDPEGAFRDLGIEVVKAPARFVAPGALEAGGRRLEPGHVLVATGSRPVVPDLPGAELFDTTDEALFYQDLPRSLLIVGGGYVAIEMAAVYASFGTEVTLAVRGDRVLKDYDQDVAGLITEGLADLGVDVRFGTSVTELRGQAGTVAARLEGDTGQTLVVQHVLAATGRRANLDGLDLEAAGLAVGDDGRPLLDEDLRSITDQRVWFAGDAVDGPMSTPIAGLEGDRAAAAMLGDVPRPLGLDLVPRACFGVPEAAKVGASEQDLASERRPYAVGRGDFDDVAEAIIRAERRGFVKLLTTPGGRLLGAQVVASGASELIHALTIAIRAGVTASELARSAAVHPSMHDAIVSAARAVPQAEQRHLRMAS